MNTIGTQKDSRGEHVTNMEEDENGPARSEATFRFTVDGISRLREQILSPPTLVQNLPWRIIVTAQSEQDDTSRNRSLCFFLQCNGEAESSSWNCSAVASLKIIAHKTGVENFTRKISHIFHSKGNECGYFMGWSALMDPAKGYIQNDSITLEVDVKANAPNRVAWDSKKPIGFVGLKNQGATCYMNSLLQTMFFTNQLRKAVYKMPTGSDDSTKSVVFALQRVFYELQTSDKPVETKQLTRSFGWGVSDSFMQHDVQEFLRILLANLESNMKGTCVEGTVPKLFEGKMISFINCKHVQYESSRSETYYDIQLNIKGKKDIYESFRDYVEKKLLDGDNKYDAGFHGLQEAEKGVIFTLFPSVLHLHLMRFEYDPVTNCSVKSNDRFEFFEKISLDEFIMSKEDTGSASYTLHAVLVHSGDNHGGHYVVFVNPKGDGRWCKFDDAVVSSCTKTEAITHNYGGQEDVINSVSKYLNHVMYVGTPFTQMDDVHPGVTPSTNAYMLVYIRDSDLSSVLQEATEADIPNELLKRLRGEKNMELMKRKKLSEAHLYMQVRIMTEEAFIGHQGVDLYDRDKMTPAAIANSRTFIVLKKTKPVHLVEILAESYGVDPRRLRLWPFAMRTNNAIRPEYLEKTSETLYESQYGLIYLEILPAGDERETFPYFDKENDAILFFKMYDPYTETLHYFGHMCVSITANFNQLAAECRRRAHLPMDAPVVLSEEINLESVEIPDLSLTLEQGLDELLDGSIIIFHPTFEHGRKLKSLSDFYAYIQYKSEITFIDKGNTSETFSIEMSLKCSYMEMANKVGQKLGVDPLTIQFFKSQPCKDSTTFPVEFETDETDLLTILSPTYKTTRSRYKLFYQVLGIPVSDLQHKEQFKVLFYTREDGGTEREVIFYVPKDGRKTVKDVLAELSRVLAEDDQPLRSLRLLEIISHRIFCIIDDDMSGDVFQNTAINTYYRAEEICPEDAASGQDEILVHVAHFHKYFSFAPSTFGVPFLFKVCYGERWARVKERLQARLGMNEKDWAKVRIALVREGIPNFVETEKVEGAVKAENFKTFSGGFQEQPWLGIEHVNKTPKRSRCSTLEKAIKIYN